MVPKALGPQVQRLDSRSTVEGVVITGGGLGSTFSSGGGDGGDDVCDDPLPWNPARGKGILVQEERPTEVAVEQVEFWPTAESSRHEPITRGDFVEFVDEEVLTRLLRDNPVVVEAVLTAREERQRVIELAQKEEWLRAEAERSRAEGEDF